MRFDVDADGSISDYGGGPMRFMGDRPVVTLLGNWGEVIVLWPIFIQDLAQIGASCAECEGIPRNLALPGHFLHGSQGIILRDGHEYRLKGHVSAKKSRPINYQALPAGQIARVV